MNRLNKLLCFVFLIPVHVYRKLISPLVPPRCKYYPTCSSYAVQAVMRYGVFRGGWLAVWRLLRCNPWSFGGFDPVPKKFDILGRHPSPPIPGEWDSDTADADKS